VRDRNARNFPRSKRVALTMTRSISARLPRLPPGSHSVGRGDGFTAIDCVCEQGLHSPVAAGQYSRNRVVVVLEGAFHARTSRGGGLLGHGALLLGNPGDAYEYRHIDDGGDRCLGFDYDERLFDDVRRSLADHVPGFGRTCVAASAASAAAIALAHEALCTGEPDTLVQVALTMLDVALTASGRGAVEAPARPSPSSERQVVRTIRYVEQHFADDCSLEVLARLSGISSFHFLRMFRILTGQTPRQFLIATRLRVAAVALRATRDPIAEVALNAGFGDLSHFNASFARCFGRSPGAYRRR
jgi:AraC family transcriptional regulator